MNIKQQKTTYHISPLWAGLAGMLFVLCLGLGYYYYDTSNGNQSTKKRLAGSIRAHQASIASLNQAFSEQKATQARERATRLRESMQSGEAVDRFIASLRPAWSVVSKSEAPNEEYISRRYQIARGSVPVSAWPEILDLTGRMKKMSSLALTQVDIQTVGDNNKREFSRVAFSFTIYIQKPSEVK